jgi:cyclopropane fatty-acyl-phospholipid synthase-like methyltransferase
MSVLDIGSGTGVFTLPFSAYYSGVTSLDISVAMQNEIRDRAEEKNIRNIKYINADWRKLDIERSGLKDGFDAENSADIYRAISSMSCLAGSEISTLYFAIGKLAPYFRHRLIKRALTPLTDRFLTFVEQFI